MPMKSSFSNRRRNHIAAQTLELLNQITVEGRGSVISQRATRSLAAKLRKQSCSNREIPPRTSLVLAVSPRSRIDLKSSSKHFCNFEVFLISGGVKRGAEQSSSISIWYESWPNTKA